MIARGAARGFACAAACIAIAGCTAATSKVDAADGGANEAGNRTEPFGLSIEPPAARVCPGDCVELMAQAGGGQPPYSYQWDHGEGGASGSNALTVCPMVTTKYSVTAKDGASDSTMAHATITVDPDCWWQPPPPAPDRASDGGGFSGNACVDPSTDPWTGCQEIVFGGPDPSPGVGATLCNQATTAPYAVSLCLAKGMLAGQAYELRVTYDVTNAAGPLPLSGVAGSKGSCEESQWLLFPAPWPADGAPWATPFTGTFVQDSCFMADENMTELLYEMIRQPFGRLEGATVTFDLCSGCGRRI